MQKGLSYPLLSEDYILCFTQSLFFSNFLAGEFPDLKIWEEPISDLRKDWMKEEEEEQEVKEGKYGTNKVNWCTFVYYNNLYWWKCNCNC